jgi:hypothetical protein
VAGKAKPILQAVIQPGSRSIAPWLVADAVWLNSPVTTKVCKMAIWRVCSVSEMLDLQLAPQPREVVGRHGIVAVTGMTGPVL